MGIETAPQPEATEPSEPKIHDSWRRYYSFVPTPTRFGDSQQNNSADPVIDDRAGKITSFGFPPFRRLTSEEYEEEGRQLKIRYAEEQGLREQRDREYRQWLVEAPKLPQSEKVARFFAEMQEYSSFNQAVSPLFEHEKIEATERHIASFVHGLGFPITAHARRTPSEVVEEVLSGQELNAELVTEVLVRHARSKDDSVWKAQNIEQVIAKGLREKNTGRDLELPTDMFVLLALLNEQKQQRSIAPELMSELEGIGTRFSESVAMELAVLTLANDPASRRITHAILQFCATYLTQFRAQQIKKYGKAVFEDVDSRIWGFALDVSRLAGKIKEYASSYLIREHAEEVLKNTGIVYGEDDSWEWELPTRIDGGLDRTRYISAHAARAAEISARLGIRDYSLDKTPVLPIAPGYVALYRGDKPAEFYREQISTHDEPALRTFYPASEPDEDFYSVLNAVFRRYPPESMTPKLQRSVEKELRHEFRRATENGTAIYFDPDKFVKEARQCGGFWTMLHMLNNAARVASLAPEDNRSQNHRLKRQAIRDLLFPIPGELGERQAKLENYTFMMSLPIRAKVEREFGIELAQYDFEVQRYFLAFLEERSVEEVEQLKKFVKAHGRSGLESFLALEHGAEFGPMLVELTDRLPDAEQHELLRLLGDAVRAVREFGQTLTEVTEDAAFWTKVQQSLLRRITELIAVMDALSKGEQPSTNIYGKLEVKVGSTEEVLTGMLELVDYLEGITEQLKNGSWEKIGQKQGTVAYWAGPTWGKGLMVQLRSEPVPNSDKSTWEFDGEARINFLVDSQSNGPFSPTVESAARQRAFSIRIDREGIVRDGNGAFVAQDPTIPNGSVSVDIGSVFGAEGSPNQRIAGLLALGNSLISRRRGVEPKHYHAREHFSEQDGTIEEFARHVRSLQEGIERSASRPLAGAAR